MEINRNNYETFFLLFLDRELKPAEMLEVEKFLSENADLQKEFSLLQQTVLLPGEEVFEQKESLLREEEKRKILPLYRLRIAAAVAVLILGGWFLKTQLVKNQTGGMVENNRSAVDKKNNSKTVEPNANQRNEMKKLAGSINSPSVDLAKLNQSPPQRNLTVTQNKSVRNFISVNTGMKAPNDLPGKNNQNAQGAISNPDQLNTLTDMVPDEPLAAMHKSSSLELLSAEIRAGKDPKQIAAIPGTQAPVLLVASLTTTDQARYENADFTEPGYQTDNAISILALNDRNKGITGFFNKLTKRTPADVNARKVRVSVFQFSY